MKKMAKKVIAATLVTSAIVPVMAVSANTTTEISFVLVEQGGQTYQISIDAYEKAVARDTFNFEIKNIVIDGKIYSITDYEKAVARNGQDAALTALKESGTPVTVTVSEGAFNPTTGVITPGTPQAGELKVESVSAITTTTVDVTFAAATADVIGATVEVKDAAGKVYAVKATDISEGDTSASFDFVTPFAADFEFTGVWTVDGKEFNFDTIAQFDAIVDAATKADQVALLKALEAAGIENVNEDLIAKYAEAIVDADPGVETLEDIQAVINEANEAAVDADAEATALKAVKEAKTQVALLKALQGFDRVNADWAKDYANGKVGTGAATTDSVTGFVITAADTDNASVLVSGENSTDGASVPLTDAKDVQDVIDAVNLIKLTVAWEKAWGSAKLEDLNAVKSLASYLPETTDAEKAVKGYMLDEAARLDAVIKVFAASTNNSLKNALTALDTLENSLDEKYDGTAYDGKFVATDLDITTVKDELLSKYREELAKVTDGLQKNGSDNVQGIITTVNGANESTLLGAVKSAAAGADKDALAKALKAYGVVQVADTNTAAYLTKGFTAVTSVPTAQTLVDTVNLEQVAGASASTIIEKLNVFGLDNVVVANAAQYVTDKTTIGASTNLGATNKATVANVKEAVKNSNEKAAAVNLVKAVNSAKSATEVKAALDELAIAAYVDIPNGDKLYIAEQVLDTRDKIAVGDAILNVVGGDSGNDVTTAKTFANDVDLTGYLVKTSTGVIAKYKNVVSGFAFSSLNGLSTIVSKISALEYPAFESLTAAQKSQVAEAFYAKYPYSTSYGSNYATDYTSLAAIKVGIDAAIKAVNDGEVLPTPPYGNY